MVRLKDLNKCQVGGQREAHAERVTLELARPGQAPPERRRWWVVVGHRAQGMLEADEGLPFSSSCHFLLDFLSSTSPVRGVPEGDCADHRGERHAGGRPTRHWRPLRHRAGPKRKSPMPASGRRPTASCWRGLRWQNSGFQADRERDPDGDQYLHGGLDNDRPRAAQEHGGV